MTATLTPAPRDGKVTIDLLDLDAQDVRDLAEAYGGEAARCGKCGRYGEPGNPVTGAFGINETEGVCTPECPDRTAG